MRYHVIYRSSMNNNAGIMGSADTLEEAKAIRQVSGDLVVFADTHEVVPDTSWLWDWEMKKGRDSYAFTNVQGAMASQQEADQIMLNCEDMQDCSEFLDIPLTAMHMDFESGLGYYDILCNTV